FPAAVAGPADHLAGTAFTAAVATHARVAAADIDAGRQAVDRFFESERERDFYVGAALRLRAALGCRARPAEEFAEDVLEACSRTARRLPEVKSAEVKATTSRPLRRRVADMVAVGPVLVVNLALFGVRQHVVGFGDLLELLFSRLVARIHIGMILARQAAIRLADLIGRSTALDAEQVVIIFASHVLRARQSGLRRRSLILCFDFDLSRLRFALGQHDRQHAARNLSRDVADVNSLRQIESPLELAVRAFEAVEQFGLGLGIALPAPLAAQNQIMINDLDVNFG